MQRAAVDAAEWGRPAVAQGDRSACRARRGARPRAGLCRQGMGIEEGGLGQGAGGLGQGAGQGAGGLGQGAGWGRRDTFDRLPLIRACPPSLSTRPTCVHGPVAGPVHEPVHMMDRSPASFHCPACPPGVAYIRVSPNPASCLKPISAPRRRRATRGRRPRRRAPRSTGSAPRPAPSTPRASRSLPSR